MRNRMLGVLVIVGLMLMVGGCDQPKKPTGPSVDKSKFADSLLKEPPAKFDIPVNAGLDGKIQILGMDYEPKPLMHNKPYTLTFYYKVLASIPDDYQFFGHFEPAAGPQFRAKMDHWVMGGKYPTSQWQSGEIIKDVFRGHMPAGFPGAKGILWGGFYKGDQRMPISSADKGRGDDEGRLNIAALALDEPESIKRVLNAYRSKGPIKLDGKLDEPAWAKAENSGRFTNLTGEIKVEPATQARVLWDDTNLYIAFECADEDIWTSFTKRDDPLYREETTEVMIDADGNGKQYYEIQVNGAGSVYDAFFPERRKNMDLAWDGKLTAAVVVNGTLNKREDKDTSWTVELAIPFSSIADSPNKPPKAGDQWKINLYRIERPTGRGTVASMWSPTMVGDFHTLDRFGSLVFSPIVAEERELAVEAAPAAPAPAAAPATNAPPVQKVMIRK